MTTTAHKFNPETDFNMDLYCAARYRIERNKGIKSPSEVSQEDVDFIVGAVLSSNGPTSVAIWSCLQRNIQVLIVVHSHLKVHMVNVVTNSDPTFTNSYMNMPEAELKAFHEQRDAAYNHYLTEIGAQPPSACGCAHCKC